jgi:hypothetical protein
VLVIIIGGGITAYAFRDKILKSILGPVKYYLYKESTNITAMSTEDFGIEGDLALGDEFSSVSSMLGISNNKINVDIQHNVDKKKDKVDLNFLDLYKLDFKKDDNLISLALNDEDALVTNLKEESTSSSSNNSSGSSNKKSSKKSTIEEMTGLTESKFSSWTTDLVMDCVVPAVEQGDIDEGTDDYNNMDCQVTTFTIDADTCKAFLNNLADKVEDDKQTQTVFKNFVEYLNEQTGSDYEFDAKEFAEYLRDNGSIGKDSSFRYEYSVYYYDGQVVNRILAMRVDGEEMDISLGNYTEDDETYIDFAIGDYISGELQVDDNAYIDDISINKEDAIPLDEFMEKLQGSTDNTDDLFGTDEDSSQDYDDYSDYDFDEDEIDAILEDDSSLTFS